MPTPQQDDFPKGHPARCDYDPCSPEARAWATKHIHPRGERDFPAGHPKAHDTEGSTNHVPILPGVDPARPDHEAFTGRSPNQAAAARAVYAERSKQAHESPAPQPIMAAAPARDRNVQRARRKGDGTEVEILCPACEQVHLFDSRWQFNGSLELPSFTPSQQIDGGDGRDRCHFTVTNGRISFHRDSTHRLSGQTCELPPISDLTETIHASRP